MRLIRLFAFVASATCPIAALDAQALTLGRAVEAPPARFASGPPLFGPTHERTFSDPFDLQRYCNLFLGRPERGYYQACFIPTLNEVVLPDAHAWPSRAEREALRRHEWAHARGWRHSEVGTASVH